MCEKHSLFSVSHGFCGQHRPHCPFLFHCIQHHPADMLVHFAAQAQQRFGFHGTVGRQPAILHPPLAPALVPPYPQQMPKDQPQVFFRQNLLLHCLHLVFFSRFFCSVASIINRLWIEMLSKLPEAHGILSISIEFSPILPRPVYKPSNPMHLP